MCIRDSPYTVTVTSVGFSRVSRISKVRLGLVLGLGLGLVSDMDRCVYR